MIKEFKEFALKGNVLDMAVGIIIGAGFGKIVTSLVSDILMPPLGLILGKVDFSNLFVNLTKTPYASLIEAKAAGAATVNYGLFFNTALGFLIIALVVFLLVKQVNRMRRSEPALPPTSRSCPYCRSTVHLQAVRCPFCTSELKSVANPEK